MAERLYTVRVHERDARITPKACSAKGCHNFGEYHVSPDGHDEVTLVTCATHLATSVNAIGRSYGRVTASWSETLGVVTA